MFNGNDVLWMPTFEGKSVMVSLRSDFATTCMKHKLSDPKLLLEETWKLMRDAGTMAPNFLDLESGSLFPLGFYKGRNGMWLSVDRHTINSKHRPVTYQSHNADTTTDREWLLRAFQSWVATASRLLYQK